MGAESLAEAKSQLFALVATQGGKPVPELADVGMVYDHEPAGGDMRRPVALTISTAGVRPDFWVVALRLYVSADSGVADAQAKLDELVMAVDELITADFGPSNWEVDWIEELGAFRALNVLECGRED